MHTVAAVGVLFKADLACDCDWHVSEQGSGSYIDRNLMPKLCEEIAEHSRSSLGSPRLLCLVERVVAMYSMLRVLKSLVMKTLLEAEESKHSSSVSCVEIKSPVLTRSL